LGVKSVMAMGTQQARQKQEELFYASEHAEAPGHPFYQQLNQVLEQAKFDAFCEQRCRKFYHSKLGRPSLAPGVYFRLLLIGFFEGIGSERGIAWRVADSLSLRRFLNCGLNEATPDHVTISRTRRLLDEATHQAVFTLVLTEVTRRGMLKGKTIGIDATTLEANAALRSIVRRDTGESYEEFLRGLAKESGIATPTRTQLARLDRRRARKGSNQEWTHPHDPEARITKMKDGRTHLAHKAEHAVDMETGAVVAVTVQAANAGDTTTVRETLLQAAEHLEMVSEAVEEASEGRIGIAEGPLEVVTDKGYHSREVVRAMQAVGLRTYISEPQRGRQQWGNQALEQSAVYANRRRLRGPRGAALQRQRGERLERVNAHLYETGRMRRVHLRGHENILKRLLIHACTLNLALLMRSICGCGTPRGLQGNGKSNKRAGAALIWVQLWLQLVGEEPRPVFVVS
jgi:transposase